MVGKISKEYMDSRWGLEVQTLLISQWWLSNTKRVSKYCIEGERGFVSNFRADGDQYVNDLKRQLENLEWI